MDRCVYILGRYKSSLLVSVRQRDRLDSFPLINTEEEGQIYVNSEQTETFLS